MVLNSLFLMQRSRFPNLTALSKDTRLLVCKIRSCLNFHLFDPDGLFNWPHTTLMLLLAIYDGLTGFDFLGRVMVRVLVTWDVDDRLFTWYLLIAFPMLFLKYSFLHNFYVIFVRNYHHLRRNLRYFLPFLAPFCKVLLTNYMDCVL